jgi:sulfur-oxidizing protein SoxA
MRRGGSIACCCSAAILFAAVLHPSGASAEDAAPARQLHSASEYLSPDLRAEQDDPGRNRGMLWVELGRSLWSEPAGVMAKSCESCHGAPETMAGAAARYPTIDKRTGELLDIGGRINECRTGRQHADALAYESAELLGLTALVAYQSRGMPVEVSIDGAARPFFEHGRALWHERQGQMNLACAQCHDVHAGRRLRGDTISSGLGTGYPAYRLEWQGLGSLHRRLRACQIGVRATPLPLGSPEYLALELFLAHRAKGLPLEAPAIRR